MTRLQLEEDIVNSTNTALNTPKKLIFSDYLLCIEGANGAACRKMYQDHREKFERA